MGSFGEDLRKERLARGIELEDITAVTKISQRHLIALEQERFRLLPGGILSKGIVRGYAGALGLDPQDWTERFLEAYSASGQMSDDDRGWTTFASNVGKARILRREAVEVRLRWLGAILLAVGCGRGRVPGLCATYGLREGWWRRCCRARGFHSAPCRLVLGSRRGCASLVPNLATYMAAPVFGSEPRISR